MIIAHDLGTPFKCGHKWLRNEGSGSWCKSGHTSVVVRDTRKAGKRFYSGCRIIPIPRNLFQVKPIIIIDK